MLLAAGWCCVVLLLFYQPAFLGIFFSWRVEMSTGRCLPPAELAKKPPAPGGRPTLGISWREKAAKAKPCAGIAAGRYAALPKPSRWGHPRRFLPDPSGAQRLRQPPC